MEALPDRVLDEIVQTTLSLNASTTLPLLLVSRRLSDSTKRVCFSRLVLQDIKPLALDSKAAATLARCPTLVRTLEVGSPPPAAEAGEEREVPGGLREEDLEGVLERCKEIEEVVWKAGGALPEELCELLAAYLPNLTHLSLRPLPHSSTHRFSALHLSLLAPQLTHLSLRGLSQDGARALARSLPLMRDLLNIDVETIFFDDSLCRDGICAARKLREVVVETRGTKLTDRGILALLDLPELAALTLNEVEGRLSKYLWTKVEDFFPDTLKSITIISGETSGHHSWVLDHLPSLFESPLLTSHSLKTLRVTRAVPKIALAAFAAPGSFVPPVDDMAAPRLLPEGALEGLLQSVRNGLEVLELDWWLLGVEDLKAIAQVGKNIRVLSIFLDAPFAKLLSLTSTFLHFTSLQVLRISIPPEHLPLPPADISPTVRHAVLPPTPPCASPVLGSLSPAKEDGASLGSDGGAGAGSPSAVFAVSLFGSSHTAASWQATLPPMREIKKFVKKTPRLAELTWGGRGGRGTWWITHGSSSSARSVTSSNVVIDFEPVLLTSSPADPAFSPVTPPLSYRSRSDSSSTDFSSPSASGPGNRRRSSTGTSISSAGVAPLEELPEMSVLNLDLGSPSPAGRGGRRRAGSAGDALGSKARRSGGGARKASLPK